MRLFVVLVSTLLLLLGTADALKQGATEYEDMSFWMKSGQDNLQRVLLHRNNEKQAKNVIVFIGDGMGLSTITAGRIFRGQMKGMAGEEYKLAFEKFPNTGLAKTYNVNKQVPDSAGTATALFSGVKCRHRVIGFDGRAPYNHCDKGINELSKLSSVANWAQETGLDTGFVTTTRITHATPAGLYAHVNNRDWECDTTIPNAYKDCTKDIARQLVEDAPGTEFKVMMGGGGQLMGHDAKNVDKSTCVRGDGKNLTDFWLKENPGAELVTNMQQLMSLDIANTSKIMGIFAPDHMPYHSVRSPDQTPSLANMTMQAIRLLRKNKNGFFLMVESGKIDLAHHRNYARQALNELAALEDAVRVAIQQVKLEETLIIVTADHSHSFTMNGYPKRGNDILGFAHDFTKNDVEPYETLTYANGPGFWYHRLNTTNVNETWRNVAEDSSREDPFYMHMASQYLKDETHGGEDVGVYAIGPYSHLIRGTFEQNYIAHVLAYAACYKNWPSHCDNAYNRFFYEVANSSTPNASLSIAALLSFVVALVVGRP